MIEVVIYLSQDPTEAPDTADAADTPTAPDTAAPAADTPKEPAADDTRSALEADKDEEECEEAWDYVEFLKKSVKEKIEGILQDTLFQPKALLEETVTDTVEKEMRAFPFAPEQNIKQEDFLTQIRMDIMSVLLALIEKDAASHEKLKEIGKQLLVIRTKANGEITRMIMLRTTSVSIRSGNGECDCGILGEVVDDLNTVVDGKKPDAKDNEVDKEQSPEEDKEKTKEELITDLTMTLMKIDSEIRNLYSTILTEVEEEKRQDLSKELYDLKKVSTDLHAVISKAADIEDDPEAIKKLIKRDVRSVRNDAEVFLKKCTEKCPTACDSCGSEKITELKDKLEEFKNNLEETEDEIEARESVRTELMNYLSGVSSEMTDLLTKKAKEGSLEDCDAEKLEVINKIKGPLWMMVNTTIFGNKDIVIQMSIALGESLDRMRTEYCGASVPDVRVDTDEAMCDEEEIENSKEWIMDIDTIISENLFKAGDDADKDKQEAMIGLIELKSSMDKRVKKLFQNNLECKEEVEQIKNIYTDKLMQLDVFKQLRVAMEDRRGALLMREIEKKIRGLDFSGGDTGYSGN
ncbi:unnamed protein product [Lepeophtheirus salmonis]|uniref:(salmon louse) hypothetical protein n=1 Tax=Lepeophtheirus salmonis TaxID=72036 RepID=A0A7R8H0V2_LEPSM|nr:unnamed protein product [Lepeophtheirus salmonis]CAF2796577.1 unnamed protein product [Lepeophtheirus salmonis]